MFRHYCMHFYIDILYILRVDCLKVNLKIFHHFVRIVICVSGIIIIAVKLSHSNKFIFFFSEENSHANFFTYWVQTLFNRTSYSRVFIYILVGLAAAPLGMIISLGFACGLLVALVFFPVLIGPLCFSLYVTCLVYVLCKIVCILHQLVKTSESSLKTAFKKCMKWLYTKTERVPFSPTVGLSLTELSSASDSGQSKNAEDVEHVISEKSFSSDENEETTQGDFRQLNVRSLLRVARPRFYAIDDLENQESETIDQDFPQENKVKKEVNDSAKQPPVQPKNSLLFRNVAVVKTYPTNNTAMKEKLEEMRRLLTTIRRRVSIQYPSSPSTGPS
ncbi:uncharacterized protein LOC114524195 [Dendronephthya gigantea]|uniref:uncharacterized protein LOC114524195 n=1 Tax=Dendronephthya gigantea TaxID=151771 RepID=UPI00106C4FDA|nr:uncharacterized protein LOC114524195 [Dendronephthya gigantea]